VKARDSNANSSTTRCDADRRSDKFVEGLDIGGAPHELYSDIFLESLAEHSHESLIVPFRLD
jgi:hypothetical protein